MSQRAFEKFKGGTGRRKMTLFLAVYISLIIATFISTINDFGDYDNTPKQIYDNNSCNMFGAVLLWIFGLIVNPLYYIAVFVWWVVHVGRKD